MMIKYEYKASEVNELVDKLIRLSNKRLREIVEEENKKAYNKGYEQAKADLLEAYKFFNFLKDYELKTIVAK